MKDLDKYLTQTHYGDVEAVGFWDDIHSLSDIHCLCSITEDNTVLLWHDHPEFDGVEFYDKYDNETRIIPDRAGTLVDGFRYWYKIGQKGGKLSIHNLETFDRLIIEKVVPKCIIPKDCYRDTFIQSKVQWFDRPIPKGCKSAHGLDAYGKRAGINKPPITDFTVMDARMLDRCIEDCKIQKYTQKFLDKEADTLSKLGIDFKDSYKIEREYARNCALQEIKGALLDVEHVNACISKWDADIAELEKEIEPLLPPTVKVKTGKITRSELMILLGYDKNKIPKDKIEIVSRDGKEVAQPVKPYYKPSVNFHKTVKGKKYSAFNLSCGGSPEFDKKNLLNAWIRLHHPETKLKEWEVEIRETEINLLNKNCCTYFEVPEDATDVIVGSHTRVSFEKSSLTQHEVVKGYLIKLGLKSVEEWNFKKDSDGQIVRADYPMEIRYPKKAAPENQIVYKVKKGEAVVTSPKVSEKDYDQLPEGIGQKIGKYNTIVHRRRFFSNPKDPDNKGLLAYVREDGRIPTGVNNFNTSTSRSSHRVWVNAPGEGAYLGEDIRKSLIAPEGRKLIGADMKSAQLAIAAYYAKNSTYYNAVASGQEVIKNEKGEEVYVGESAHCFSSRAFGLVTQEEWQAAVEFQDEDLLHSIALRRKKSKGASFGVIFGCSGKKLAGMLSIPESEGNKKKDMFLEQMGLQGVSDWLKDCKNKYAFKNGWYIPLPFGYWIFCKSDHKAINYIIQGTEAVCQKVAVNWFEEELWNKNLDSFKVLDYQDEYLCESSEKDCEETGQLMCDSYRYASDQCYLWHLSNEDKFPNIGKPEFAFNLDGGYKVGENYLETH